MFFWRDILLYTNGIAKASSHPDLTGVAQAIASQVEAGEALRTLRKMEAALQAVTTFANLQLVFESLALELPQIQLEWNPPIS
jgi:hypothetical protein